MTSLRRFITSDIPFARDDAHRLLPLMIGCLVAFAALLLVAALSLHHRLEAQAREVAGVLQIEVPVGASATVIEKTIAQLQRAPGVIDVVPIDRVAMEKLLTPWLGEGFSMDHLPVPVLLEATTKVTHNSSAVDLAALRKTLQAIDADIHVTERGPWINQWIAALHMLQSMVLIVAGLLMLCVIGMVMLVARTNLKLHFKTVGLLHMFGATDDYILNQFQWESARLAARGAFAGVIIAAVLFLIAVSLTTQLQSPVIPALHFTVEHAVALVFLPLATAFVALLATRLTVRAMLYQMH